MTLRFPAAFAAATLLACSASHGQTTAAPDASGPQTATPAPRTDGRADVPGGSARDGVVAPPSTGGIMPVIPPPAASTMPVIPPGGGTPAAPVQPK